MRSYYCLLLFLYTTIALSQENLKTQKFSDSISYYLQVATFNKNGNNYQQAYVNIQKAIQLAQDSKNINKEAESEAFLASLYFNLKRYDDAIESYYKSIALYSLEEPSADLAFCHYGLGLCFLEKEDYEKAELSLKNAGKIYDLLEIPNVQDLLNLQRGIVYKAKGKKKDAVKIFNQIIAKPAEQDVHKVQPEAFLQMGLIEFESGRNNLSLNYLQRALEQNLTTHNTDQRLIIFENLSNVHEKMSNLNEAYFFLKKHKQLHDSIQHSNKKKNGAVAFDKFKENERLKTIEQQTKENAEQRKLIRVSKLTTVLSIALITILSLLSLSLYKNNIIKKRTNQLLQDSNSELEIAKNKAEKALRARAEFLSTVSHELRTPLNAINGITHLMIEEDPKESQKEYLKSLKFSGTYLLTYINEILEINRIESENIEIEKIEFNLKQLLDDIQNALKELASQNNVEFVLEKDDNIAAFVLSDPTKLSQILINLINNALKFTENGRVLVRAKVLDDSETEQEIYFEVVDNGIGIPADKQNIIFESFSQGSVEINRKYGGTGLGLAIVKRLVSMLGGEIKLNSATGLGSNFNFSLRFKKAEDIKDYKIFINDSDFVGKEILLVEDNKINQMITRKMLEKKKIKCQVVENGEDAIEALRQKKYNLVLMDVHLPGINGTIATQQIRTFDNETPIVALTAISLNENRENLLSFGMNDVLTKPFNPDNFYRIIATSMRH
ncbi:response regulator [Flavobacterium sp. NST-5]|uniref:histidine kinase n=1 Tax=Flavobacterium ichthyis TaxID=2698827 RepID=A0ABW9Z8I9_9FLAO|nr:response regulator [Flavobacterium ichthyis]NBL64496.1 response regulator [Flavobacterium ichthyis]